MRRLTSFLAVAIAGCTDVGTDPDAVVALRFEGSSYPSIVAGDSLRDSLGTLQPLIATGLNYKGEPVEGAEIVFSSPDTVLQVFSDGVVFARARIPSDTVTRVFATVGTLQSQPDSLFRVPRADTITRAVEADTAFIGSAGAVSPDELAFTLLGDTAAGKPKLAVRSWLVSFQLRYRGNLLIPTDTTVAYSWTGTTRRILSFVDTTDASGRVGRKVFVRTPRLPEDTIYLVATARQRRPGSPSPLSAEIRLLLRQGSPTAIRVAEP